MANISEADAKELCEQLMRADSEADVVQLLTDKGLWEDESSWRPLDDNPDNFGSAGNQQSRPEQAIVEKLVNSIDAKLMNEARLCKDISMERNPNGELKTVSSTNAPKSINEAREKYFGRKLIYEERQLSESISVVATGNKKRPCFSIIDDGEGQSPLRMPNTILSLNRGNKSEVPFVQGKHNMGGTGALPYCSEKHNLQLVISKRNPNLPSEESDTLNHHWGFTIVRRERPSGNRRASRYTYLAPLADDRSGSKKMIMHFGSDTFPIFPETNKAYSKQSGWGTLIKLYEYSANGFDSMMMRRTGLRTRMNILLPEPALPIRFHECRTDIFQGKESDFDRAMSGVIETLERSWHSNKEDKNVIYGGKTSFNVGKLEFSAKFYVFEDKASAEAYRKSEVIVFTYNGQCHSHKGKAFFGKRKLKNLHHLKDEIIVFVDCSEIDAEAQEELFMNSRDRFREQELYHKVIDRLESVLAENRKLIELAQEKYKRLLRSTSKDEDEEKSFAKTLENILKSNPDLIAFLKAGSRISSTDDDTEEETEKDYKGERFPTIFHFFRRKAGEESMQVAQIGSKAKILFETDANDDYFSRDSSEHPGIFTLYQLINGQKILAIENFDIQDPNLLRGIAYFSLPISKTYSAGESLEFIAEIDDENRTEPFVNKFTLRLVKEKPPKNRPEPREKGLELPKVHNVIQDNWNDHNFDKFTGITATPKIGQVQGKELYDYYFNMDNVYLQHTIKRRGEKEAKEVRQKFKIGMTLIAMAVIAQEKLQSSNRLFKEIEEQKNEADNTEKENLNEDILRRVALTTSAMGPFLLPIMEPYNLISVLEDEDEDE